MAFVIVSNHSFLWRIVRITKTRTTPFQMASWNCLLLQLIRYFLWAKVKTSDVILEPSVHS